MQGLFKLLLPLAIAIISCPSAWCLDEREDEEQGVKLHEYMQKTYWSPIYAAASEGHKDQALQLCDEALKKWKASELKSSWSLNNQAAQIVQLFGFKANLLKDLGKYEESAQTYLQIAEEDRIRRKNSSRTFYSRASEVYAEGKMYDKAIAIEKETIAVGTEREKTLATVALSNIYLAMGDKANAEKVLVDWLQQNASTRSSQDIRTVRVFLSHLYHKLGQNDKFDGISSLLQDKHCPRCGSDVGVEPITYGLIVGNGHVGHAGGCCVSVDSPQWWCKNDQLEF